MELHQLRYVLAVGDTGNFTRAAERCSITQPSLSQQILNLESELGHKLFHRLGRNAVPTEAGSAFLERARRIIFEVEDASRAIKDDPKLDRRIVVGSIPTVAPYLLPQLIDRCRTEFPNLLVHTREDFRPSLLRGVLDGELDLALVSLPIKDPHISVEKLYSEPLLLAVGVDHRLAKMPEVNAKDLEPETFILLGESSTLTMEIQRFCGDHDFQPKIGYRCAQIATVKSLVSLGLGIAILPQTVRLGEDRKTIVYRQLSGQAPSRDIAIIRHQSRYQSRGAEQFLTLLRTHLRQK